VTECAVYRGDTRERIWHGDLDITKPNVVEFDPVPGPVTIFFAWLVDGNLRFGSQSAPRDTNVGKVHVPPLVTQAPPVTVLFAPLPWQDPS
jgi:hypothetical protein